MASNSLRMRRDLVIRRLDTREGASFVVKDPETDQFYRFRDVEHFIITQLDGNHSEEAIRAAVEERYGAPLGPETLGEFLKTLRRHRLLETERPKGPPPPRSDGGVLAMRFKTFDPDRLLDALEPRTRFLFTRPFVIGALVAVGMALVILLLGFPQLLHELQRVHLVKLVALAWLTSIGVSVVHELAHALACRRFGGRVREMGFMLLYFQPALYCNVSDAWLFPEKARRLWVTLAGVFSELVIWALAMLAWAITEGDTTIHQLALIALTATGLRSLFNLNPLLKLDGYYLLSDALEIPNLRRRAFQYVGAHLRRWFGFAETPLDPMSDREGRIFAWYGWLGLAFSVVFLVLVMSRLAGLFLGSWQAYGIVPFLLLLVIAVRRRLSRLAPKSATRPREAARRPRWAPWVAAATACVVTYFLYTLPADLKVTGEFLVVPLQSADVRSEVDGLMAEVLVDEGHRVKRGDPIARLDDRELRTQLVKIQSQQDQLLAVARYAGTNLTRHRALREAEVVSQKELESAEQQVAVAQADLQRLEADRRLVEQQLQSVFINSPLDGVITTSSRELKELRGRYLRRGDRIAQIHELSTVMAEIAIPEKEIADVVRGQEVVLKARAYPHRVFTGRVTTVATRVQKGVDPGLAANVSTMGMAPAEARGQQQVLVTTLLENPSLMLKPDMTGKAKILCGRRNAGELLLRRLARTVRVELWSWW